MYFNIISIFGLYIRKSEGDGRMRVDCQGFKNTTCKQCKRYIGNKLKFGKCAGDRNSIYNCARMMIFNEIKFKEWIGISSGNEGMMEE